MQGDEARTMTASPPLPNQRAPDAATAFLRGVRRRATALAWLQTGDGPGAAGGPVDASARAFATMAPETSMDRWPLLYWRLLVSDPSLRTAAPDAGWPEGLAWLGDLPAGVRAALLLRLVAQLEPAAIAAALEVPVATVHAALRAALPLQADGTHDPLAWHARQAALREALDAMPASALPAVGSATPSAPPPARHGTRSALWAGVAACVLGFAATFLPGRSPAPGEATDSPAVAGIPLAPSEAPVVAVEEDVALLAHPDLEQLADGADATVVRDLDFYAWYAARLAQQPGPDAAEDGDAR